MKTISTLIVTLLSGVVVIEKVIPDVVATTVPIFNDAITHQENTVQVAEYLELSCAKLAREQWEVNKAKTIERIEAFKQMSNYEQESR